MEKQMQQKQQGFEYEKNSARFLKKLKVVKRNFVPASSKSNKPDLELNIQNKSVGVELKITDASAGSLVLKYINNKWGFDESVVDSPEKQLLADISKRINLFSRISSEWKHLPKKFDKSSNDTNSQKYEFDKLHFKEINGAITPNEISKYYNLKNCYYVNIGTHGFYTFGTTDPAKFQQECIKIKSNNIPDFNKCITASYRARVQSKGANYQFTLELQFVVKQKSPYNIAPCSKTSVNIIETQFHAPFLLGMVDETRNK